MHTNFHDPRTTPSGRIRIGHQKMFLYLLLLQCNYSTYPGLALGLVKYNLNMWISRGGLFCDRTMIALLRVKVKYQPQSGSAYTEEQNSVYK